MFPKFSLRERGSCPILVSLQNLPFYKGLDRFIIRVYQNTGWTRLVSLVENRWGTHIRGCVIKKKKKKRFFEKGAEIEYRFGNYA